MAIVSEKIIDFMMAGHLPRVFIVLVQCARLTTCIKILTDYKHFHHMMKDFIISYNNVLTGKQ